MSMKHLEMMGSKVIKRRLEFLREILGQVRAGTRVPIAYGFDPCGADRGYDPDGDGLYLDAREIDSESSTIESIDSGFYTCSYGGKSYTLTEQDIDDMKNYMQILENLLRKALEKEGKKVEIDR